MKRRLLVWLLLAAGVVPGAGARERNAWPFRVDLIDDATDAVVDTEVLGPLFERRDEGGGRSWEAWRPFVLKSAEGDKRQTYLLYPLFMWRSEPGWHRFSFFDLVNDDRLATAPGQTADHRFDVWPFYFSRDTGEAETSYHALFPVAGTIKQRFGKDRLTWYLFPLYFDTEAHGMRITSTPWPFIATIRGAGHHGFEFWPVYGERGREGDYHRRFYLWPLGYDSESHLSAPVPDVRRGFLPFYALAKGPGYIGETYLGFFGYTHQDRVEPTDAAPAIFGPQAKGPYDEKRYFWPFLLQGRGPDHYVNRWGPFYTHSVIKGLDKTWVMWPLWRDQRWQESGVAQEKRQLFFFVYSSQVQRSLANPHAAPAVKTHLWPLFSAWDNGAGRKQFQLLSPFEVFFPGNEPVRRLYTPLFALYRSDQQAPDDKSGSLLWHLVSWRHSPARREFHLGPLGWVREAGDDRTRFFLFDFRPKRDIKTGDSATP